MSKAEVIGIHPNAGLLGSDAGPSTHPTNDPNVESPTSEEAGLSCFGRLLESVGYGHSAHGSGPYENTYDTRYVTSSMSTPPEQSTSPASIGSGAGPPLNM